MEYSPAAELPRISRVDAGTVELVRSLGVDVVSSADTVQYAAQRWTAGQLASHETAAGMRWASSCARHSTVSTGISPVASPSSKWRSS